MRFLFSAVVASLTLTTALHAQLIDPADQIVTFQAPARPTPGDGRLQTAVELSEIRNGYRLTYSGFGGSECGEQLFTLSGTRVADEVFEDCSGIPAPAPAPTFSRAIVLADGSTAEVAEFSDVTVEPDGTTLVLGRLTNRAILVARFAPDGEQVFANRLAGIERDPDVPRDLNLIASVDEANPTQVIGTSDGGTLIGGTREGPGTRRLLLLKLDRNGDFDPTNDPTPEGFTDVELTASARFPLGVSRGNPFEVDVTVSNATLDVTTTGVVVEVSAPPGVEFASAAAEAGSYDAATGTWTIPAIAPAGEITLALKYRALGNEVASFVAEVAATDQEDVDSTPGNAFENGERANFREDDQDLTIGVRGSGTPAPTSSEESFDLELTATSADPTPERYAINPVTYVITNTGAERLTGDVDIFIDLPEGTVYEGGNEFEATRGNYSLLPFGTGLWSLTDLEPGASESITVNFFARERGGYVAYAEVRDVDSGSDVSDPDSQPGNGDGVTASEDDEVALDLRYGEATAQRSQALAVSPSVVSVGSTVTVNLGGVAFAGLTELLFVDVAGRVADRQSVHVLEGDNLLELPTGRLGAGVFVVSAPATGAEPVKLVVR